MIKSLFNVTRPTVPIFVRSSGSGVAAACDATTSNVVAWARSDLVFPIRRVYCVGRNYREHAIEMGGNPDIVEPPFFFQKPADAIVVCDPTTATTTTTTTNKTTTVVPYPPMTSSLHHEGELIVAIGSDGGLRVRVEDAMDHVYGYAVGCDLTRRDLQDDAKREGRPWDTAKGFDHGCPMSPIVPKRDFEPSQDTRLALSVNDTMRQTSTLGRMIHPVPEIVSNLSRFFALRRGDLILTGTPAGVSNLSVGDIVSITCGDLIPCRFVVGEPE
jgi:fumarylpyruvate hydrolase